MGKQTRADTVLSFALTAGASLLFGVGAFLWVNSLTARPAAKPRVEHVNFRPAARPQVLGVTQESPPSFDALIQGSSPTLYYAAADGFRYVFPNERTFGSWFSHYGQVVTVSDEVLAAIPLKGNVTYRPGVRLVKIQTSPRVYAVDAGGTLRWIGSEAIAAALYGPDWSQKIDDIPDVFFTNYREGKPITRPADYQPATALTQATTINQDRGMPESATAPRADTVVGGTTTPASAGEPRPAAPLETVTSTPPLPAPPTEPTTPTTTPPTTPDAAPPACPPFQQFDPARGGCAPLKDKGCGVNGYRDRYGGCIQLPVGRSLVADWAVCGDKNCDLERGEHGGNCPADCPGVPPPTGWATTTPTTTPSGTTPAVPATPATPATPAAGGAPAAPATPATPAVPPPETPAATSTSTSTPSTSGTIAPVIADIQVSNITASNITINSATVTWNTNVPTSALLYYGPTPDYGGGIWFSDLVTAHSVTFGYGGGRTASLIPATTYYFQITSKDSAGNETVSSSQFTTLGTVSISGNGSLTATLKPPNTYDPTHYYYHLTLSDPDGMSWFSVRAATGNYGNFWQGGGCVTSMSADPPPFAPADFPITASVVDCANPSVRYTVQASLPPLP